MSRIKKVLYCLILLGIGAVAGNKFNGFTRNDWLVDDWIYTSELNLASNPTIKCSAQYEAGTNLGEEMFDINLRSYAKRSFKAKAMIKIISPGELSVQTGLDFESGSEPTIFKILSATSKSIQAIFRSDTTIQTLILNPEKGVASLATARGPMFLAHAGGSIAIYNCF